MLLVLLGEVKVDEVGVETGHDFSVVELEHGTIKGGTVHQRHLQGSTGGASRDGVGSVFHSGVDGFSQTLVNTVRTAAESFTDVPSLDGLGFRVRITSKRTHTLGHGGPRRLAHLVGNRPLRNITTGHFAF